MNEEVREEEIKEDGSSIVEIEEETTSDEVEASTEEKEETRTNVREDSKTSDGDEGKVNLPFLGALKIADL